MSQLEKRTMPFIIAGAVRDLQKKGMDIGFVGEDTAITIFMRPMEYTEFFLRFHGIDDAMAANGVLELHEKKMDPPFVGALQWWMTTSAAATVKVLRMRSTGDRGDAEVYTVTMGEETIDLSQKNLGPVDVTVLTAWIQRPEASATVNLVNVIGNAIGESGAQTLIKAFDANPKLQSLLGIEPPGFTSADLSNKNMMPHDCIILAHEMKASRAAVAVTDVNMSGNPLTGKMDDCDDPVDGKDISGVSVLFPAMTRIITLNVSNCGLGPTAMPELSKLVRDASAVALTDVNMSGNPLTGGDGKDISGVSVLFPVMTSIIKVNVSNCGLGPTAMPELYKLVRDATAVVNSLTLSGNPLTGASTDKWKNIDSDMSGFIALCAILGKLNEVDLSDCHLGVASAAELAKVFSDDSAVLASVNLSGNRAIDQESRSALQESVLSRQPTVELIWDK
eukprot:COSAG01_NODE_1555_length_9928_cov_20.399837_10_plen_449_part_00